MVWGTPIARLGRRIAAYDVTTLYPLALLISVANISDDEKQPCTTTLSRMLFEERYVV